MFFYSIISVNIDIFVVVFSDIFRRDMKIFIILKKTKLNDESILLLIFNLDH